MIRIIGILWRMDIMSVPRIVKKFFSDDVVTVDLGQSWKLFDNHKNFNTIVVYNGVIYEPKNSRKRGSVRIDWIETDKGPFVLASEDDFQEASKISKMSVASLRAILASNPIKNVAS